MTDNGKPEARGITCRSRFNNFRARKIHGKRRTRSNCNLMLRKKCPTDLPANLMKGRISSTGTKLQDEEMPLAGLVSADDLLVLINASEARYGLM